MKFEQIEAARDKLTELNRAYLQRFGWVETCNIPGSYWLWRRDFAAEDSATHAAWVSRGPGPMGWPSEPKPWGAITAGIDMAVNITRAAMDPDAMTPPTRRRG